MCVERRWHLRPFARRNRNINHQLIALLNINMIDVVHNKTLSLFSVSPTIYIFVLIAAIPPILWVRHLATKQRPLREVPILNANEQTPGESWHTKPRELLSKGIRLYSDQPFQIITHGGPRIALPRRYLEEVRDSQQAAFPPYFLDEAPWNLPGFDGLLRATNMRRSFEKPSVLSSHSP